MGKQQHSDGVSRVFLAATVSVAGAALGLAAGAVLPAAPVFAAGGARRAAVVRPLIVVFPAKAAEAAIQQDKSADHLSPQDRTVLAARTVRDCLNDSGVVAATIYSPDAPMYKRAALEAGITLVDPDAPTETERAAIGKAVGAAYVLSVAADEPDRRTSSRSAAAITLEGMDVQSRKSYTDHADANAGGTAATVVTGNGDAVHSAPSAAQTASDKRNALQSTANTLVARLLAGPLAEFARPAAPPNLLPPSVPPPATAPVIVSAPPPATPAAPAPTTVTDGGTGVGATPSRPTRAESVLPPSVTTQTPAPAPPLPSDVQTPRSSAPQRTQPAPASPAAATTSDAPSVQDTTAATTAATEAVLHQNEDLLRAGDTNASIVLLRHAIDQAPDSLPLRAALTRAYLAAHRGVDAAGEAKRALALGLPSDPTPADRAAQSDLSHLLSDAYAQSGDAASARQTFENALRGESDSAPKATANWARLGLANLFIAQNQPADAEKLFRDALHADPSSRDATLGVARLLMDRGDYEGARRQIAQLAGAPGGSGATVFAVTISLFDERALHLGETIASNRDSFDHHLLSREALFRATAAQTERVNGLISLLKAAPPPSGSPETVVRAYKGRLYAASLLGEAVSALSSFLQTGDTDAGAEANVQLIEFQREMTEARRLDGSATAPAPAAAAQP